MTTATNAANAAPVGRMGYRRMPTADEVAELREKSDPKYIVQACRSAGWLPAVGTTTEMDHHPALAKVEVAVLEFLPESISHAAGLAQDQRSQQAQ